MNIIHHEDYPITINSQCFILNEYVNECPDRIGRHKSCCDIHRLTNISICCGPKPSCGRCHNASEDTNKYRGFGRPQSKETTRSV